MRGAPNEITLKGFVDQFGGFHRETSNRGFVWVLGAGASVASGIPLGPELVDRWLNQMHLLEEDEEKNLESWATEDELGIPGFTLAKRASFYPEIYQRRFRLDPEDGYADLESIMSGKDPSPGYSILAAAMAANPPRHSVVITTNFDNLVADALAIYTDTFPFVAGHESLARFVRVSMRRPLICKIHRDLLLAPQSDRRSLRRLHDAWGTALRALFQHYRPLFIGYGGNDETLMDLMESLEPEDIEGRPIWCYHNQSEPTERIRNLVAGLKGSLVKVPDFDLLMVLLGEQMGIGTLDEKIGERARKRTEQYRDRLWKLDIISHRDLTKAFAATLARSDGWWAWHRKAFLETDLERREWVYREGILHFPKSAELLGHFANFMRHDRRDFVQADDLYHAALRLDPRDAAVTCNFADFTTEVKQDHDEAEILYRRALNLDPMNAMVIEKFAIFMTRVRGFFDEAEDLCRKLLELEPENADRINSFANFLTDVVGDHVEAEQLYRQSLKLAPQNVAWLNDFAGFLWHVRKGSAIQVDWLYRRALELDPKSATVTGNYAGFLLSRELLDEASKRIEQARCLNESASNQLAAELAFYEAIVRTAKQRDDASVIHELKRLCAGVLPRRTWDVNAVLAFVQRRLSPLDYDFFSAVAGCVRSSAPWPDVLCHFRQWAKERKDFSGNGDD
jgi:Tfp pilus assembly protein PilF